MSTLLWSYLGWRRFPSELSGSEVRRLFAFSASDRHALRRRFRRRARLGAALQLGFVRMTGTLLDAFDHVPREVLAHVGHQLSVPAPELTTLRAISAPQDAVRASGAGLRLRGLPPARCEGHGGGH